ncbi:MAG: hypothetical protein FWD88_06480, partial [Treponema sp.]|nr:hypothetical protein [Treponema sp.]
LFLWFCYYILGGGLVATFLNMDENLEYQSKLMTMLIKYKQKEMKISEPLPGKSEPSSEPLFKPLSETAKNNAAKETASVSFSLPVSCKKYCDNCGIENDEKEKKCKDCGCVDFSVL